MELISSPNAFFEAPNSTFCGCDENIELSGGVPIGEFYSGEGVENNIFVLTQGCTTSINDLKVEGNQNNQ